MPAIGGRMVLPSLPAARPALPRRCREAAMTSNEPLDVVPLWALLIGILLIVLLSVEGGYRVGRFRAGRMHEMETPVGEMVAATLGLLAFLLAFTFGLAASRFDTK